LPRHDRAYLLEVGTVALSGGASRVAGVHGNVRKGNLGG